MNNAQLWKKLLETLEVMRPHLSKWVQRLMPSLLPALKAILPRLPKRVLKIMPGFLPFLPLALEIARLLYKHRREIRDIFEDLIKRPSKQSKQVSDSIAMTVPRLPKKVGRKLRRRLKYLPFALEIAKASYRRTAKKFSV